MDEPRSEAASDSARRLQLHGRATRALIAHYIHDLSVRHGGHSQPACGPRPVPTTGPTPCGEIDMRIAKEALR